MGVRRARDAEINLAGCVILLEKHVFFFGILTSGLPAPSRASPCQRREAIATGGWVDRTSRATE
jgi:hypothetical protein